MSIQDEYYDLHDYLRKSTKKPDKWTMQSLERIWDWACSIEGELDQYRALRYHLKSAQDRLNELFPERELPEHLK